MSQAIFWARYVTDTGDTADTFSSKVLEISTGNESFVSCQTLVKNMTSDLSSGCEQPDRDVVFLIDMSVSGAEAIKAVTFVNDVIARLKLDINQGRTVVGLAQYSDRVEVSLPLCRVHVCSFLRWSRLRFDRQFLPEVNHGLV